MPLGLDVAPEARGPVAADDDVVRPVVRHGRALRTVSHREGPGGPRRPRLWRELALRLVDDTAARPRALRIDVLRRSVDRRSRLSKLLRAYSCSRQVRTLAR